MSDNGDYEDEDRLDPYENDVGEDGEIDDRYSEEGDEFQGNMNAAAANRQEEEDEEEGEYRDNAEEGEN